MAEPIQKTGKTDTKLELLLAAERLFATKGFDATTVKEITEASGQRNQSVIHYHFGSREAILDAIIEMRVGPMNEARERLRGEASSEFGGPAPDGPADLPAAREPDARQNPRRTGPSLRVAPFPAIARQSRSLAEIPVGQNRMDT